MVRASASKAVDSGQTNDFKMGSLRVASLLDAQHYRDSVEGRPASLLVVPLGTVRFLSG